MTRTAVQNALHVRLKRAHGRNARPTLQSPVSIADLGAGRVRWMRLAGYIWARDQVSVTVDKAWHHDSPGGIYFEGVAGLREVFNAPRGPHVRDTSVDD
jgi:hypothetical protein